MYKVTWQQGVVFSKSFHKKTDISAKEISASKWSCAKYTGALNTYNFDIKCEVFATFESRLTYAILFITLRHFTPFW